MKVLRLWFGWCLILLTCMTVMLGQKPASVSQATTRKVVASKGDFVLGLRDNGTVFCVNTAHAVCYYLPEGLSNVVDIDVGEFHGIALKSDGTVVAWGALTADNQLNGGVSYGNITNITNAVAIAAGADHTLVLLADGTLRCFGNNEGNRCSAGSALTNVIDIDAADRWSMALLADGRTVVWGKRLPNSVATSATPFGSNNFLDDNLSSNFNSSMKVSRNDHNDSEQQSFQRSGSQKNYDSNATLSVSSKLPNSSSSHGTSSSSSIESLNNLNNPPIANKKPEARKPPQPPTGDDFFSSFGV